MPLRKRTRNTAADTSIRLKKRNANRPSLKLVGTLNRQTALARLSLLRNRKHQQLVTGQIRDEVYSVEQPNTYKSLFWRDDQGRKAYVQIEDDSDGNMPRSIAEDLRNMVGLKIRKTESEQEPLLNTLVLEVAQDGPDAARINALARNMLGGFNEDSSRKMDMHMLEEVVRDDNKRQYLFKLSPSWLQLNNDLVLASSGRTSNANYSAIRLKLNELQNLSDITPATVKSINDQLARIADVEALLPGAQSNSTFHKKTRNEALATLQTAMSAKKQTFFAAKAALQQPAANAVNHSNIALAPGGIPLPIPNLAANVTRLLPAGDAAGASESLFDRGPNNEVRGIFKPEDGEAGKEVRGAGAMREVVGYALDQYLGLGTVPETQLLAVRNSVLAFDSQGNPQPVEGAEVFRVGSYQKGVNNPQSDFGRYRRNDAAAPRQFDADSLQKMAIFDVLTLNADRQPENVMYLADGTLKAIDQGEILHNDLLRIFLKLTSETDPDGMWAWADVGESEGRFSNANKDIIRNLDADQLINMLQAKATQTSNGMAAVAGTDPAVNTIPPETLELARFAVDVLKMAVAHDLSPAELESIFKKRKQGRDNPEVNKGKVRQMPTGGGEFADFIKETFLNDYLASKSPGAAANAQPASAHANAATQAKFREQMNKAVRRLRPAPATAAPAPPQVAPVQAAADAGFVSFDEETI